MASDSLHPHVAFATRYGEPTTGFLNAYTALLRAGSLVEDAQTLQATLEARDPPNRRWAPWYGAEVVSYYSVGYVTCLEWHARSRIVDLFTYRPSALKPDDLRQINEKMMVQMLAENASVARLIGASTSVGSFKKYMTIMVRIFSAINVPVDAYEWLKSSVATDGLEAFESSDLEQLELMFSFRNELVHEINNQIVGHPNIRDSWSPSDAVTHGARTLTLIKRIERAFTAHAPGDFPHLLEKDGWPVFPTQRIEREIARAEEQLDELLQKAEVEDLEIAHAWAEARDAARAGYQANVDLIEAAGFLHSRYVDYKTPLRLQLAEARLAYLRSLLREAENCWGPYPDSPD